MHISCRCDRKESEYTCTAGGVDPQTLDQPQGKSKSNEQDLVHSVNPQDWTKYYEQTVPGTSTDLLDTDEARQAMSLILQQASVMAAQGGDETPLIFATQTAATVADLDIEGFDPDEPSVPLSSTNVMTSSDVRVLTTSQSGVGIAIGVPVSSPMLDPCAMYTSTDNTRVIAPTVLSMATGASSVTSVLPFSRSQAPIQPYNSSAIYADSMLPVYVDYIGSIMPILDRQSIATNWPPTPHPTLGQVRFMPYNSDNLPTVPYLLNVGNSRLLPELIRGVSALSEVALRTPTDLQGDSVSQM